MISAATVRAAFGKHARFWSPNAVYITDRIHIFKTRFQCFCIHRDPTIFCHADLSRRLHPALDVWEHRKRSYGISSPLSRMATRRAPSNARTRRFGIKLMARSLNADNNAICLTFRGRAVLARRKIQTDLAFFAYAALG